MSQTIKRKRIAFLAPIALSFAALFLLMAFSGAAVEGARQGLYTCGSVIVPSLLPFFVVSGLLSELGAPGLLGKLATPITSRLFGVSGVGVTAFILGLSGGYPLGAATVSELYISGELNKKEAERLLDFVNNSGPAFIFGAAGAGIFKSAAIGILIYIAHALSAVILGLVTRRGTSEGVARVRFHTSRFSEAFPAAIKRAGFSCAVICSFVVFFASLMGVLRETGLITALAGAISQKWNIEMSVIVALITGLLELGSGIASLSGFPINAANVALCTFIVSFGSLSVYCQSMALIVAAKLNAARLLPLKLLHGVVAAFISFLLFKCFL